MQKTLGAIEKSIGYTPADCLGRSCTSGKLAVLLWCLASGILFLVGCSTLSPSASSQVSLGLALKGQGVAYIGADAKFKFNSMNSLGPGTVAALAGGVVGAVAVGTALEYSEGEQVVKKTGLTDPAVEISRRLGQRLNETFGSRTVGEFTKADLVTSGQLTASATAGARYILDLRTNDWGGSFAGSRAFTRVDYQTRFRLRATLIDVKSGVSLARGECHYGGRLNAQRPTYDELMENSGARLHDDMAAYSRACVQDLWDQIFAVHEKSMKSAALHSVSMAGVSGRPSPIAASPADQASPLISSPSSGASNRGSAPLLVLPPSAPVDKVLGNSTIARQYHLYLSKPKPKAFAVSESGGWWMAWGESLNPTVKETIPQRALRGCQERSQTPCVLYAVDDKVVYGQGLEGKR